MSETDTTICPACKSPSPFPLDYYARPQRSHWLSRALARMTRPMPVAIYFLIMPALSIVALVLAVVIRFIVLALK
jgi:hypothetical protein